MKKNFYLLLILLQISAFAAIAQTTTRTLVRTGHILDVKTGAEPAAQTIIVTGDRITAIAPTASTPKQSGDTEIDLTRYTVMPGLIDVHTHLTDANNFDPYFELTMTPAKEAIIGVENAKVTLEADRPRAELDALVAHARVWSPVANTFTRPVNLEIGLA